MRSSFCFCAFHAMVAVILTLTTAGCTPPARSDMRQRADTGMARNGQVLSGFRSGLTDVEARIAARTVNAPWLAGRAQALARVVTLPPALRRNVDTTLLFEGGEVGLSVVAQRIYRAVGIPVRVRPEALLPLHHILPRLSGVQEARIDAPVTTSLRFGPAPLADILDGISARLGVHWRYENDHILFFRTDSRAYQVRALSVAARADARLGRSARGGEGGFENTSNTSLSTGEPDVLAALRARLEPYMTRAGTLGAEPGAVGSIVVTDTPDALDRIGQFLALENKSLTRRVRLIFEEITVNTLELQQRSVDWQAVYAAGEAALRWGVASGTGAGASMHARGEVRGGPWQGSTGLASALSRYATVHRHTAVPLVTLNRRPVTHAVRTRFSYVDGVQRGVDVSAMNQRAGTDGASAISQKEETVGVFLTVLPDVQEDGRILLSVAYDNTVAQPLSTLEVGSGKEALHVQQITIDGSGTIQQIEIRAGQSILIAGFDRHLGSSQTQRVLPSAPLILGGADKYEQERVTTLIFLSAQIDETQE